MIEDKYAIPVLLCGSATPSDDGTDMIIHGPMSLREAIARYAICDSQMEYSGCRYVYITTLNGKIILSKQI